MVDTTSERNEELSDTELIVAYQQHIAQLEDLYRRGLILKKELLEAVGEEQKMAALKSIRSTISKNNS
jgi:uncharacterized protein